MGVGTIREHSTKGGIHCVSKMPEKFMSFYNTRREQSGESEFRCLVPSETLNYHKTFNR